VIGDYIKDSGVNIYLDINDKDLQAADLAGDEKAITRFIERGIGFSTDVLALISAKLKAHGGCRMKLGMGRGRERNWHL